MAKQERLDTPGRRGSWVPRMRVDQDTFGTFAEQFARLMGTAGFLFWMTVLIIGWLIFNLTMPRDSALDPWPFMFLTLVLSLQASYAAPLILLAQNRQEARDRVSLENDRIVAAQSRADMDFLAREIASLRMRMNDVATRDFIRSELRELLAELQSEDEDDDKAAKA